MVMFLNSTLALPPEWICTAIDAFGWNFGVLFDIIDGFDTVDVELVMLALAADDVGVPAVFFENVFEGAGVSFDQ